MPRRALASVLAVVVLAAAGPALAWSEAGHRVIGQIAYARLTAEARRAVDALIVQSRAPGPASEPSCPVATLADAAVFLECVDGIRAFNDLRRLHYEAAPLCGAADRAGYCKDGECASEGLKRALATLADPAAPPATRLLALQVAAHVMGDLHQPMQMIDNRDDRGADIRVTLPGTSDRRMNLNRVWDEVLPALAVGSGELGARFLEPMVADNEAAWSRGGVDSWAAETQGLARSIYQGLPERPECGRRPRNPEALDRGYLQSATRTAREQLAKAGLRLAAALNATLR